MWCSQIALRMSLLNSVAQRLSVGLQMHGLMNHNLVHKGSVQSLKE